MKQMNECNKMNYVNVFERNQKEAVYCYRSGLTVYEERFVEGALVPGGWNAAGYPLNVLSNYPTFLDPSAYAEPTSFHVELDGECMDFFLEIKDYEKKKCGNGTEEVILTLSSTIKPVEIKVHTLLDGTPVLTRWMEVTNLSDRDMALSKMSVLSGALDYMKDYRFYDSNAYPEDIYEIGYFQKSNWCAEGDFAWKPLDVDRTSIAGRFHRGRYRYPAFFLKNKMSGLIYFGQMGWSSGYEFVFDYNARSVFDDWACKDNDSVALSFEMSVTGFHPLRLIASGETYVSPKVHMGAIFGTLDDAVNAGYDHIRRSALNLPEAGGNALLVGAGMGAEHDMSMETSIRFADQMRSVGAEIFIVDAGWYCPPNKETEWCDRTGDWIPDKDRYPNGIKELRDYLYSIGMKFGLWMEPERLGSNTRICKEHPEWFRKRPFGKTCPGFVDFTNPEAVAWVESEIARVIEEYQLDLFRVDYNINSTQYHYVKEGQRYEYGTVKHYEAVYAMYERLKKRFPNVIFENCAGGGGRLDLAMLRNFNHTWVSDCQKAPMSQYITNGISLVLPPERMDRLVAGMGCHAYASLDYHMRNAMLGHLTLNVFSPAAAEYNQQQKDFIRHSVELYKSFIRPMLPTSRMYHHNEDIPGVRKDGYSVLELASADRKKAAITVLTVPGAKEQSTCVIPRGLDASGTYRVTLDNTGETMQVTGRELVMNGVSTRIMGVMTSELILIEAVEV